MFKKIMYKKAVDFWNSTTEIRQELFDKSKDRDKGIKWNHLVWQEISMWISIGKQVTYEDFKDIVERRGFDYNMAQYLLALIEQAGLDKKLKDIEILERARVYKEEKIEDPTDLDIVIRDIKRLFINKFKSFKRKEDKKVECTD